MHSTSDSLVFHRATRLRLPISALGLILLLASPGCVTRIIPPTRPANSVTIFLTDYGKHSSLLLPRPDGGFDEYAFGDWEYFALGHTGLPIAIRALLGSPQSTLGRRYVPGPADETLKDRLGTSRVMELSVSRPRADALALQLDARFRRSGQTSYFSNYSNLHHVRDNEFYWLGNNCNHVTARWLRQLDCTIDGPGVFSNFTVVPEPYSESGRQTKGQSAAKPTPP